MMSHRKKNKTITPGIAVGVIGAGSWGTAIAGLLAGQGYTVDLWAFEKEVIESIETLRENKLFLPGIRVPEGISPTDDIARVAAGKDLVVIVVPSHFVREVSLRAASHLPGDAVMVSASKGIENKTHLTMTGILQETLPESFAPRLAVLSGPSFAREVAAKAPTVVTVAAADPEVAAFVQHVFATPHFRVYTNTDVIGVELGGAVKNVIAIASGIVDGLGLGLNARAALITRGLTEIRRLGIAMGANPHTFSGLAGMGDLVLTCTGNLSRNHTVGYRIGQGKQLSEILSEMKMVAEGVKTAKSVYNLSRKRGVEMPISHAVYQVLYEGLPPAEAVFKLMTRDLKDEMDDFT
jgi:glycerol-3-phosphate dehydrogenase (NAD(P)+)